MASRIIAPHGSEDKFRTGGGDPPASTHVNIPVLLFAIAPLPTTIPMPLCLYTNH